MNKIFRNAILIIFCGMFCLGYVNEIREYSGSSPKSLNYYLDNNVMSARVFSLMYETLITTAPDSLEYVPNLASKWEISDDLTTYTFWLDPEAKWSDGHPITAEDVVWTWHAVVNPDNLTGPHKYRLERTEPPQIVDNGKAVQFKTKSLHWATLGAIGGFEILPKHIFENLDFNQVNFEFPVTSGPYQIEEIEEGRRLVMKKNSNWWQKDRPLNHGHHNFNRIILLFFEDRDNAFDAFKKHEIDVFTVYSASQWHNIEEKITPVRNNWIVKRSVRNQHPIGMQGFVMNLRRPLFQDVRIRRALALLLDREMMNKTMMFGQYFLHKSYWEDLYDEEHPCHNPENHYAPSEAARLLSDAGWKINPATGWLTKDGKIFEFDFLAMGGAQDKFLSVYGESLKSAGIKMNLRLIDWSAWAKAMDSYDFDMTWAAWGSGLFKDPEQLWYSAEAARPGSSNLPGYANPEVDRLIEQQRTVMDVEKRNEILRQIDSILTREYPYILLWNTDAIRLLYWNQFGMPENPCGKYDSDAATYSWWLDLERQDELDDAMQHNLPLP